MFSNRSVNLIPASIQANNERAYFYLEQQQSKTSYLLTIQHFFGGFQLLDWFVIIGAIMFCIVLLVRFNDKKNEDTIPKENAT